MRYGFAVVLALGSFVGMLLLEGPVEGPIYALLVGAVAVAIWYGGFGPGLLTVAVGWSLAYVAFVGERAEVDTGTEDDLLRWSTAGVIGLAVVWVSAALRRGRERAGIAAEAAEASVRDMSGLQELASGLSAAVTPSDVAHALIQRTPPLLGARGGALGLIEGHDLVIVDPQSVGLQTHAPGFRLPLTARAPISHAAHHGVPVNVSDRETFEREYPDGAALTLYAHGAVAVPIRVGEEVVGSMSYLFPEGSSPHEDAEAIALLAADLGGQALERSRLYARERDTRQALDRILRVAPRFHADTPAAAAQAICIEAQSTFDSDVSMLWQRHGTTLELLCGNPANDHLSRGLVADLSEFPRLEEAVEQVRVSFLRDVGEEATGEGLERIRRLGIRSSLRAPIATGAGEVELVLIVSWTRVVPEPDPSTFALVRRFADQAGLALEHVERRRAQEEAAVSADETRRLQEITAALSIASTATDVSNTCLEHALSAVGADAGFVVLIRPDGVQVEFVTSTGYDEEELAMWGGGALDHDVPFGRAIASGEAIWALTPEEMAGFTGTGPTRDRGWASVPLRTPAGIRGALHLSFREPRILSEPERRWLQTVVSQCAQALERSRLFDVEQLLRRRSERLQSMTAALANALTRMDVANIVVDEVGSAIGADATALAVVVEERGLLRTLARRGFGPDLDEGLFERSLEETTPANRALRRRVSAFYETREELLAEYPEISMATDHTSYLFVPLVAGRRASALLVFSWADRYALATEERRFVETLAGQAAQALDRAAHFEIERTIAETLQRSVLPVTLPRVEGVQIAARYLPGTAELDVGGDWFDAINLPDGRLGLVVGDVVGKGVQAAATMAQLRNALRAFSLDRMKPSSTMARLNRLAEEVVETAFATLVYAVVDPDARVARVTSAGHPPPLVLYADGRAEFIEKGRGLPLGAGPDTRYSHAVVELPVGTTIILYTDGLVERRGRTIDQGLEAVRQAAVDGPGEPEELVDHILGRVVGDAERGDDIALLVVRLMAVAPKPLHVRIPSDVGALDLVRDAMRIWLVGTDLTGTDAQDVVLAAWEACANAVEHGATGDGSYVDVRAEVADGCVRISVADSGHWRPPTEREDRGLGLRLISASMSSVEVTEGEEGTRVTFEKALAGASEPR